MSTEREVAGWMIQGFDAWVGLLAWLFLVVTYAIGRSIVRPTPDPIRLPGPVD